MRQAPSGPLHEPSSLHPTPSIRTIDLVVDTSLSTWNVPPLPPSHLFLCPPFQETFPSAPLSRPPWVLQLPW